MPPAICDSEDEDAGEIIVDERPSQRSVISWAAKQVESVAINLFDGADDQTTGSTGMRQSHGLQHHVQI